MTVNSARTQGRAVALVLDPHFGSQVQTLGRMPIRIVSSAINDRAATQARSQGIPVTVLLPVAAEAPLETLRRALAGIEDHHGKHTAAPYEALIVYGAESGFISPELMSDFGFKGLAGTKAPLMLSKR